MRYERWEKKARIIYEGTKWYNDAIAAGKAMDNRMNATAKGPYGQEAPSSVFDITQWLAFFDYEVLTNRKLLHKAVIL